MVIPGFGRGQGKGSVEKDTKATRVHDWRETHRLIKEVCAVHVVATRHLTPFFSSRQAACRGLGRMRKRGKIPCLGQIVEKDTGRPTFVYGPYDPGRRMYRHELLLASRFADGKRWVYRRLISSVV